MPILVIFHCNLKRLPAFFGVALFGIELGKIKGIMTESEIRSRFRLICLNEPSAMPDRKA